MKYHLLAAIFLIFLVGCSNSDTNQHNLRVNIDANPTSLDPRIGVDRRSQVFSRMFFEGLTRMQPDGSVGPGVAERIEISDDQLTYTFFLRESYWTNGEPVTAYDFEYAWKDVLRPDSDAPFAEVLFMIKNGKDAKIGAVDMGAVGVHALDAKTLQVELEHPTSYFLELVSNGQYSPVLHTLDQENPAWGQNIETYVGNGPFQLEKWSPDETIVAAKNPIYWDADRVKLEGVTVSIVDDPNSVYQLYEKGELDWVGEPFSELPVETIVYLRDQGKLQTQPIESVFRFTFDVEKPPFTSQKMRQAFSYAIDRQSLIDNALKGGEQVVTSLLPPELTLHGETLFIDSNQELARKLFDEALLELGMTREEISPIVFDYATITGQKTLSQALQHHWQEVFDIEIKLRGHEWVAFRSGLYGGEFVLAGALFYSVYHDPVCLLDTYRFASNRANSANWESVRYVELLELADNEANREKRNTHLKEAEALIIVEMPVAPVFAGAYKYTKSEKVKDVFVSDAGYVDFKWASLQP